MSAVPGPVLTLQLGMSWFPEQQGNGLDRYFFGLTEAMDAAGCPHRGLIAGSGRAATETNGRIRAFAPQTFPLLERVRRVRESVDRCMEENAVDLIASHFALYAHPVRRRLNSMPHVVHFHGPWAAEARAEGAPWWKSRLQHHQERSVYGTADRVITLSKAFARVAVEDYGVPESRVRIIPGGIDAARFAVRASRAVAREQLGLPLDRPIVCCVRRLARRMGLEVLLKAMEKVARQSPNVLLLIAGKGVLEAELKQQIKDRQLVQHVQLLGFVPDEQLPLLYRASDLSIVPTQSLEGFGLITLESLAAGTPVLVTPVGGLPEAVGGLAEGLVLADASARAMAQGLIAGLSGNYPLPSSQECREYVRSNFDWPIIARRVLEVYQEAIDAHGR